MLITTCLGSPTSALAKRTCSVSLTLKVYRRRSSRDVNEIFWHSLEVASGRGRNPGLNVWTSVPEVLPFSRHAKVRHYQSWELKGISIMI